MLSWKYNGTHKIFVNSQRVLRVTDYECQLEIKNVDSENEFTMNPDYMQMPGLDFSCVSFNYEYRTF